MLAIILKDLYCYVSSRKYRRIQFITLCTLSLVLFIATVEFYAHRREAGAIDVGKQTYMLFIIALFIVQFWVPRHAVEALDMERGYLRNDGQNAALLALTALSDWEVLGGKLIGVVIWAMWGILLTIPLFALSSYIGGLSVSQWLKCGGVLCVSSVFFALLGIGAAVWFPSTPAKTVSYGCVLLITFLPFIPSALFESVPVLAAMSPLCALLSIFRADPMNLWVWNVGLFSVLSVLIFPILVNRKVVLWQTR
ncbi:MAG: hypothetical protein OXI24_00300 [Candidatus Poribacteria bacterium]|nr:hypothetical protein [Candidatus Poribacteria bacterium]